MVKPGDYVTPGDIIGRVQETSIIEHRIMVPVGVEGTVEWIHQGEATIVEPVIRIKKDSGDTVELPMMQKAPVRIGRKYKQKLSPNVPLVTGQRVIDTFFPVAKGGVAAVPRAFWQRQDGCTAPACKMG